MRRLERLRLIQFATRHEICHLLQEAHQNEHLSPTSLTPDLARTFVPLGPLEQNRVPKTTTNQIAYILAIIDSIRLSLV